MNQERAAIIELLSNGKRPGEILKLLHIPKSRRKIVYRTIQRYNKTGGHKRYAKKRSTKVGTTPRLKKVVIDRIRRNPRRSLRKMASELKVSHGSMQNLVKNDLHLKSFKRRTVHFLSEKIVNKETCLKQGHAARLATQPLENTIFSEEKLFTIEEATNKQMIEN
ncbi:MhmaT1 transposase [Oopsacas minuta]|uniref:MhmaT1 transposase n=1 Tax=Oopsacas minuta TaxID=111878 RepID=A0AAV7JMA1_9METZ|nr:MhmaT1 transposase [Oopsacas minuta]